MSSPSLDARGRRLRAALAAVLVRDNAPELRLARLAQLGIIGAGSSLGVGEVVLDQRGQRLQQPSEFATRVTFSVREKEISR